MGWGGMLSKWKKRLELEIAAKTKATREAVDIGNCERGHKQRNGGMLERLLRAVAGGRSEARWLPSQVSASSMLAGACVAFSDSHSHLLRYYSTWQLLENRTT